MIIEEKLFWLSCMVKSCEYSINFVYFYAFSLSCYIHIKTSSFVKIFINVRVFFRQILQNFWKITKYMRKVVLKFKRNTISIQWAMSICT